MRKNICKQSKKKKIILFIFKYPANINHESFILCAFLKDNNGSIENEELRGFLKDLLELVKKVRILWSLGKYIFDYIIFFY